MSDARRDREFDSEIGFDAFDSEIGFDGNGSPTQEAAGQSFYAQQRAASQCSHGGPVDAGRSDGLPDRLGGFNLNAPDAGIRGAPITPQRVNPLLQATSALVAANAAIERAFRGEGSLEDATAKVAAAKDALFSPYDRGGGKFDYTRYLSDFSNACGGVANSELLSKFQALLADWLADRFVTELAPVIEDAGARGTNDAEVHQIILSALQEAARGVI